MYLRVLTSVSACTYFSEYTYLRRWLRILFWRLQPKFSSY